VASVLMVIAPDQFRDEEYEHPREVLLSRGVSVTTASVSSGACYGRFGAQAEADVSLADARADDYDAVVFVGGGGSRVFFEDPKALELAKKTAAEGKLVAAICIAPTILANAGLLVGRRATAFPDSQEAVERGGGTYTGRLVEVDGLVVTANGPEAARDFGETIADMLQAGSD